MILNTSFYEYTAAFYVSGEKNFLTLKNKEISIPIDLNNTFPCQQKRGHKTAFLLTLTRLHYKIVSWEVANEHSIK